MVMQARKLPRLSDGYFDRNQTHSFENSNKYSKSDRTNDKVRASPIINNTDASGRNDVSENRSSPRYHRPCSQRLKDKDHHEDSSKSPVVKSDSKGSTNKEHKSQSSSDRETSSDHYQSNHDRNEENEKRLPVSDWSEHISSSGKKYYYNCKTEVSQWEKPKELVEWERQQNLSRLSYDTNRSKERGHDRNCTPGASKTLRTIQQALQLTKQVTNLSQATDSHHSNKPSASPAQSQNQVNHHSVVASTASSLNSAATYSVNSTSGVQFPDNKVEVVDRDRTSPSSDSSTHSVRHDSPTSSVSSLQSLNATAGTSSLATAALKPSIPTLSPSLANYYREDLISHVVGWQADHAERQANRYWEEAHNVGSLDCTQVSAELKISRALVRLAEIQATLQEQRILFLRQQNKELEEWRSLNSFMGDS